MLCENCKKLEANTTITKNINGHVTVRHLCGQCAAKQGLGAVGSVFGSMLGGIFSDMVGAGPVAKCRVCGSTFSDFTRTGKAGCPNCYTEFYPQLLPTLQKIHGKVGHVGKVGESAPKPEEPKQEAPSAVEKPTPSKEEIRAELKAQLAKAIEVQEFEQAAQLRDQIKALD